jgi:hypothetical protein
MSKKKVNSLLTKNGNPRLKAMSAPQIQKLIDQGTQKNATSKIGKKMAKLKNALCRKFTPLVDSDPIGFQQSN